jgi:hypothetical protein
MKLGGPAGTTLLAALVCAATACHGDGSARLQGKWRGLRTEGVGASSSPAANAFATGMSLEVKGDTITVTTPKDKQSGHYKVLKEDRIILVITTDKDSDDDKQTFTFIDDKTMRWAVVDGAAIVFGKQ